MLVVRSAWYSCHYWYRAGGSQRLPRLVGKAIAKDIIFTGRKVDGKEALSLGMLIITQLLSLSIQ